MELAQVRNISKSPMTRGIDKSLWWKYIAIIFCIKISLYAADHRPMFFLSDSANYLSTALHGYIPIERSFIYGFLIRAIAVTFHTLNTLILFQVLISAASAIALVYILVRFFAVSHMIAMILGAFCAIEPLQIFYERYVMTECVALFIMVIYLVSALKYLERPTLVALILIPLAGAVLISIKLSYLPIVWLNTVLMPVLGGWPCFMSGFSPAGTILTGLGSRDVSGKECRKSFLRLVFHILVALATTFGLHSAYKNLNGFLSKDSPAYSYASGFVSLAFWAPLLKPIDFPRPELSDNILAGVTIPLDKAKRHQRNGHYVKPGGIDSNIRKVIADDREADRFAKQTAKNILSRDPLGVISLYLLTYTDYWQVSYLKKMLLLDRGEGRPLPEELVSELQSEFGLDAADHPNVKTVTNRIFYSAWPWYLVLLCSPGLAAIALYCVRGDFCNGFALILIMTVFLVVSACHLAVVRYLHPLGWFILLSLGPIIDRIWCRMSPLNHSS